MIRTKVRAIAELVAIAEGLNVGVLIEGFMRLKQVPKVGLATRLETVFARSRRRSGGGIGWRGRVGGEMLILLGIGDLEVWSGWPPPNSSTPWHGEETQGRKSFSFFLSWGSEEKKKKKTYIVSAPCSGSSGKVSGSRI